MRSIESAAEVEWELWYQDLFDRETPRQVERSGRGLAEGLIELWKWHLLETVQENGIEGLSRFNLWLRREKQSVVIEGSRAGHACACGDGSMGPQVGRVSNVMVKRY